MAYSRNKSFQILWKLLRCEALAPRVMTDFKTPWDYDFIYDPIWKQSILFFIPNKPRSLIVQNSATDPTLFSVWMKTDPLQICPAEHTCNGCDITIISLLETHTYSHGRTSGYFVDYNMQCNGSIGVTGFCFHSSSPYNYVLSSPKVTSHRPTEFKSLTLNQWLWCHFQK